MTNQSEPHPGSQGLAGRRTQEFRNFADVLKAIMAVRKDDLDLGPVRPRKDQGTGPKKSKISE